MAAEPAGEPPAPTGNATAGARCGVHEQVAAVDLCQRCGTFLCGDCVELRGPEAFCSRCYAWLGGDSPPSRSAMASLLLGLLGLFTLFVPGLIGLLIARRELQRIDAGRSPESGRRIASLGRFLGWINLGLFSVAFLILAGLIAFTAFLSRNGR